MPGGDYPARHPLLSHYLVEIVAVAYVDHSVRMAQPETHDGTGWLEPPAARHGAECDSSVYDNDSWPRNNDRGNDNIVVNKLTAELI